MKRNKLNVKKIILKSISLSLNNKYINIEQKMTGKVERNKLRQPNYNGLVNVQLTPGQVRDSLTKNIINENEMKLRNEIENKITSYNLIINNDIKYFDLKILFIISNYERQEMLQQLLKEIKNINADYVIFDDVSSYKIDDVNLIVNDSHRGKENYWKTFDDMFKYCKGRRYDIYVFTPNDFLNYDMNKIIKYGYNLKDVEYVFNIINDGRKASWNNLEYLSINNNLNLSFFTDCGFFTNYKTLELLEFKINEILIVKKNSGSFVGSQLTSRLLSLRVPILTPIKSFAYHGDHDSLMNYEIRKLNKLKSQ